MTSLSAILTVGGTAVVLAFVTGQVIFWVGRLVGRPFASLGLRLFAGAIMALPVVAGLFMLTTPLYLLPDTPWLSLVMVPLGLASCAVGLVALRWLSRQRLDEST